MTRLLEQAIEVVGRQPKTSQNDFARVILHLAGSELEAEPVEPAHFGGSAGRVGAGETARICYG
jgi:hypothetical protein